MPCVRGFGGKWGIVGERYTDQPVSMLASKHL